MFEGRIRELVAGHATLTIIAEALLAARSTLLRANCAGLEKRVRETARTDQRTRLLMSDAGRGRDRGADLRRGDRRSRPLRSSKQVGAHFGLTPRKYQSGETDVTGRISKIGDGVGAHGALRGGEYHSHAAGEGLDVEALGDGRGQAGRPAQG